MKKCRRKKIGEFGMSLALGGAVCADCVFPPTGVFESGPFMLHVPYYVCVGKPYTAKPGILFVGLLYTALTVVVTQNSVFQEYICISARC